MNARNQSTLYQRIMILVAASVVVVAALALAIAFAAAAAAICLEGDLIERILFNIDSFIYNLNPFYSQIMADEANVGFNSLAAVVAIQREID